jgi:hypothetical protein
MKQMTKNYLGAMVVISTAALYGCSDSDDSSSSANGGSGGSSAGISYSGNTSPASIDADNAEAIGVAAGEAISQAASTSFLPSSVEVSESSDLDQVIQDMALEAAQQALLPSGIDVSAQVCTSGGTANTDVSGPATTTGSGALVTTTTFNACDNGQYTITGTVSVNLDDVDGDSGGMTIVYDDVTVSGFGYGEQTLSYSLTCTDVNDPTSCSTASVFTDADGTAHQISDYSISGTNSSGYNGTATFSHGTFGSVSITATDLTYGSCGSSPDGGSISFTSGDTSGEITFAANCTVSGSWNDGTGAVAF